MDLNQRNYPLYFYLVTGALAICKILFTLRPEVNLFTEEAQYWLWSQNMAWHYYSKPPLVAVLNYISTSLLGNTELAVRINAILCGVGISWVTYLFGTYLYSKKVGFWAAMVIQAMPFWWLASTFHMTDSSLTFFWILSVYLAYRGIQEERSAWWMFAALAAALGILAKYVMILIFPVLFIYLLFIKQWKTHKTNFLVFVLISLLGFIPALIWNWQNNFDTFRHLLALSGAEGASSKPFVFSEAIKRVIEYFAGQLAVISLFLLPVWFASIKYSFKRKNSILAYLLLPGIMAFLAFAGMSVFKNVMANWPAFAYSGLAIVLAAWLDGQTRLWKKICFSGIVISIAIPLFFLLPDFSRIKSVEPVKQIEQKALKRLLGHEQLAKRIDYLKDSLGIHQEFIFTDSYHTASELSFYLSGNPQTYVLNMGTRKNQFDYWGEMDQFVGKQNTGIFVSWNYNSFQNKATFQTLLHEESFTTYFHKIPRRPIKIQIWSNLMDYDPFVPSIY